MKVPSSFELGGRTWEVRLVKGLADTQGKAMHGLCHPGEAIIELDRTDNRELLEHSFWHEVVHAICFTIGYPALNDDEDRVDAIGGMLLQLHKTKEGKA